MRIAYLINQYPKVSHSFIRREILALERLGIEVIRISIRGQDIELVDDEDLRERKRTRYVLGEGIPSLLASLLFVLFTRPLHLLRALKLSLIMGWKAERPLPIHVVYLFEACLIFRWLKAENVDHIHAHFGTNSAEVAMLTHMLGGPPWSFTVHGPKEFEKVEAIGLPEKIRRCVFVAAISSFGRSQLYRLVPLPFWSKIHVIHCGMDTQFLAGEATPVPSARRLVCVGRLCEQKGQLLLLEATRRLVDAGETFELVLAGDGEMRSDVERFIARYQLGNSVRITGWISAEEVRCEMLAARALVLPSFAEGLPVVIMEAMTLRRPVISTYVAGIPELVRPGKDGWLVPAGDVDQLVQAMRECLNTPASTLTSMVAPAYQRVLSRHSADSEAVKLARIFEDAIN